MSTKVEPEKRPRAPSPIGKPAVRPGDATAAPPSEPQSPRLGGKPSPAGKALLEPSPGGAPSPPLKRSNALPIRDRLKLTRDQLARLLAVSSRTLAYAETGTPLTPSPARRLTELERLEAALGEVMRRESIGEWLMTPNPAFENAKPLELVERGEVDRLWAMVYYLRSGTAY